MVSAIQGDAVRMNDSTKCEGKLEVLIDNTHMFPPACTVQ